MATHEQNKKWRERSNRVQVCWNLPVEVIAKLDDMVEQQKKLVADYAGGDNWSDMSIKDYDKIKNIKGRPGVVAWLATAGSAWDYIIGREAELVEFANEQQAKGWQNYEDLYETHLGNIDLINSLQDKVEAAEHRANAAEAGAADTLMARKLNTQLREEIEALKLAAKK